jgi:hypothetical protein
MPADDENERLTLDGAIDMAVSEKALQEAVTIGIYAAVIDRATHDHDIGFLYFLVIRKKVIFIEAYLGLGAKLHTPFAAGVFKARELDELVFVSAFGHNRLHNTVGIALVSNATGTEADYSHISPQKPKIKTNCNNMQMESAIWR